MLFPDYTIAERWVDAIVHVVGLVGATAAVIWLFVQAGPAITTERIVTGSIYSFGLLGMLSASTLYNLARAGRLKSIFRRLDHAMIFVMIAGTYTPLSLTALRPGLGIPLCAVVWALDEPRRRGFAYGTLPGHPECGEESFLIEWDDQDEVWLTITVFSVGATWYTRAVGPLVPWFQRLYAVCCAAVLRRAAQAEPTLP